MMNMIFKKVIARRTFLRGLGTTLAFPLLDGMASAFAAKDDPANRAVTRLAFVYVPNGIIMKKWTPTAEGADFELAPLQEPLAPFRDSLRVLSGLDSKEAWGLPGEMAGEHSRAAAAFLTGAHAKPYATGATSRGVSEPTASTSVDQVAAKEFGKQTQLASLELGIESPEVAGACDAAYACSYFNTICWRTPTEPLPMENHPRAVFERLFGDSESTDPAKRLERIRENRSILDMLREETARFLKKLGPADRDKEIGRASCRERV